MRKVVACGCDFDCLVGNEVVGTIDGTAPIDEAIEHMARKAWWNADWERLYRAAHAAR